MLNNTMIAVPNTGTLHTRLVEWLLRQKAIINLSNARPLAHNRNLIVDEFLKSETEHLLMVDSDIVPPVNVLDMIDNDVDICSAFARIPKGRELIPVGMVKNEDGYHHDYKHSAPGLHKVDAVGTGCILIRRNVFEVMKKPYFQFVYNEDGFIANGEDFNFCDKAKEAGFDIYFDSRYRCQHYVSIPV